ncbi:MAG: hypothetical protein Q8P82_03355, partial [bacterium]|nr:hypothetical protein [bacterium]
MAKKITLPLFLLDKDKANVMWHDLKRFAVITRGFLENIDAEVYGKIPNAVRLSIAELQAVAVEELLYIENVMVLTKIDLGQTAFPRESVSIRTIADTAREFLEPLTKERGMKLQISLFPEKTIHTNQRYATLALENMLCAASALPQALSWKLSGVIHGKKSEIMLEGSKALTGDISQLLQKNISRKYLFVPSKNPFFQQALYLLVAQELARALGGKFQIINQKKV